LLLIPPERKVRKPYRQFFFPLDSDENLQILTDKAISKKIIGLLNILLSVTFVLTASAVQGQIKDNNSKFISIGTKRTGICLGNAKKYNGIRLNLWDKVLNGQGGLGKINGFNFSFFISNYSANGIQIGGFGVRSEKIINGIQFGGLFAKSKSVNGVIIGGLGVTANRINGLGIGGYFGVSADTLNGVFVGLGIGARGNNSPNKIINGLAVGIISVGAEKVKGVTSAILYCYSSKQYGLSIAGFNKTENLHGIQVGIINYAGNNPKLLKWLPIINFHL
jgi:hypothetical protein